MRHIAGGGKVSLALEKWVNKSLGRTPVEVYIYSKDDDEKQEKERNQNNTGYRVRELAVALFSWS